MFDEEKQKQMRTILQHVGQEQRKRQHAIEQQVNEQTLDDNDNQLVTDVDRWSEDYLRDHLPTVIDAPVLGEEFGGEFARECWIVDPLDGTLNYAHGLPYYAISVGFYRDEIQAGFLYFPELDTYATALNGEARVDGEPVSVSNCPTIERAAISLGYGNIRKSSNYQFFQDALARDARHVVRYGAATYEALLIATGSIDGFFELLKPWDVAAGGYLIECAGGTINGFSDDDWLRADCHVMSNGRIQDDLRQYIQQKHFPLS